MPDEKKETIIPHQAFDEAIIDRLLRKTMDRKTGPGQYSIPGTGFTLVQNFYNGPYDGSNPCDSFECSDTIEYFKEILREYLGLTETEKGVFVSMVKDSSITLKMGVITMEVFFATALELDPKIFRTFINLAKEVSQKMESKPGKIAKILMHTRLLLNEELEPWKSVIEADGEFDTDDEKKDFLGALEKVKKLSTSDFYELLDMLEDPSLTIADEGKKHLVEIKKSLLRCSDKNVDIIFGMVKDSSITLKRKK